MNGVLSADEISDLRENLASDLPAWVDRVLASISVESVRRQAQLSAEVSALRNECRDLREQVARLQEASLHFAAISARIDQLSDELALLRRPSVSEIVARAHNSDGKVELIRAAVAKRENAQALATEHIQEKVRELVASEIRYLPSVNEDS